MSAARRIIRDKSALLSQFESLCRGDIICGNMPLRYGEEHLYTDLLTRGVLLIPAATAQLASKSKAFQAAIFKQWMVPDTAVIYNIHQLLELTSTYNSLNIGKVVLKLNRKNAGMGILLYNSVEDVYNQAAHNLLSYPFVIQPCLENIVDVRVVILDDYIEAYTRTNPNNFRNNLHCGGKAAPHSLSEDMRNLCDEVMHRGGFPYAHLDLMITPDETIYVAEVNLRGGLRGAKISTNEYKERVKRIENRLLDEIV